MPGPMQPKWRGPDGGADEFPPRQDVSPALASCCRSNVGQLCRAWLTEVSCLNQRRPPTGVIAVAGWANTEAQAHSTADLPFTGVNSASTGADLPLTGASGASTANFRLAGASRLSAGADLRLTGVSCASALITTPPKRCDAQLCR